MIAIASLAIVAGIVLAVVTAPHHAHHKTRAAATKAAQARPRAGMAVAAGYLGVSTARLRGELSGGRTLAQVAHERGKPTDGLIEALVSRRAAKLTAAVAAGRLTKAQADRRLARLRKRARSEIDRRRGQGATQRY